MADKEEGEYRKRHWLLAIGILARQLKDAALFEQARLVSWPELSASACEDIGRVYPESGDPKTALSWLERLPNREFFRANERDQLLLALYRELKVQEKLVEAAWRVFTRHRSDENLAMLSDIVGEKQRDKILEGEVRKIFEEKRLSYSDAKNISCHGRINLMATCIRTCFLWPTPWKKWAAISQGSRCTGRFWNPSSNAPSPSTIRTRFAV